jgi:hypothetical protein
MCDSVRPVPPLGLTPATTSLALTERKLGERPGPPRDTDLEATSVTWDQV